MARWSGALDNIKKLWAAMWDDEWDEWDEWDKWDEWDAVTQTTVDQEGMGAWARSALSYPPSRMYG